MVMKMNCLVELHGKKQRRAILKEPYQIIPVLPALLHQLIFDFQQ